MGRPQLNKMKTIVQNLAIEYSDEGSGSVILMLHGWKDSLQTFDALSQHLPGNRIVRLDLPGFGQSDMPKQTWDISRYADFVREFIRKINLEVDALIGHSFGGRIAIRGVGSGVLKPRRLVLISAAGLARRRTVRNKFLAALAKTGKLATLIPPFSFWKKQLRRKLYGAIGSDYFSAGALKDTFVSVVAEDLSQYAPKISAPTLIVWGRDDDTTPLDQAERIHALVSGSTLRIIDNAGHYVHQERPEDVAQLIKEFPARS